MASKSLTAVRTGYSLGLIQGVGLTVVLAVVARQLALLPFLNIMGAMVLAILLGIMWRNVMEVPDGAQVGISFAAKKILRYGIILMGLRLDIPKIIAAGPLVIAHAALAVILAFVIITFLGRKIGLNKRLTLLIAAGTGICGAAAIAAVAPVIRSREDETAVGVTIIALLGTLFTIIYSIIYPVINLTSVQYGFFAGSSLHELAHVIAAAQVGGTAVTDLAILVKLARVALLIPVVLILSAFLTPGGQKDSRWRQLQVPWFILGFLALSGVNTLGFLPPGYTNALIKLGLFLLTTAMAGLGLNVEVEMIKRVGARGMFTGLAGSLLLSLTLYLLVFFWGR